MTDDYRKHRRDNTRRLRSLIRSGKIVVDVLTGSLKWSSGKPIAVHDNGCGYLRFKIQTPVNRWYFVHKAVYLASGKPYRHDRDIDHVNHDRQDNRAENLSLLTPGDNRRKAQKRFVEIMEEFSDPPAF